MKYHKKLVGQHLYLSPMNPDDAETYVKWFNDPAVTDPLGASCRVTGLEGERQWLQSNSGEYQFAIVSLQNDRLIGNCGIQNIDHIRQTGEVGIFIGDEENRGKGYGPEVLGLLLDYGFDTLNLHNIFLRVFSFNERAIACYKKAGFQEIGRRREAYYLRGRYFDEIFMDILKSEHHSDKG